MGHREDLLEGAKRCLLEKGFVRTTARDIVKESGTNLASIGYHYGSKDALLAQAYVSLVEGMGDAFDAGGGRSPRPRPARWSGSRRCGRTSSPPCGSRGSLWRLSMELLAMGDRLPEVRDHLAEAQREAGRGLVPLLSAARRRTCPTTTADTVGAFYQTLMTGLIAQWIFDPATRPTRSSSPTVCARFEAATGAASAGGTPTGGAP